MIIAAFPIIPWIGCQKINLNSFVVERIPFRLKIRPRRMVGNRRLYILFDAFLCFRIFHFFQCEERVGWQAAMRIVNTVQRVSFLDNRILSERNT